MGKQRREKRNRLAEERKTLDARVTAEAPPSTTLPSSQQVSSKYVPAKLFAELPLSALTLKGMTAANFTTMTAIQRAAIPHALCGRDIRGAAKTGSGKTLAFLIPVLEKLFRLDWCPENGLGALIISPTRELSLQIFEVLRTIGVNHCFSAGLIIGGRSTKEKLAGEKERITAMNIIVCTPGRLLQHMDETPQFSCDNLQVLVLDEADRICDLGFEKDLNAILKNLPPNRQTLLFSATQSKSMKSLEKLSLVSPEIISVHEDSSQATPSRLSQQYILIEAHKKFDLLFSFLRTHLTAKILVFVASRKQASYLFEMFRRLKPGISLSCLHGKQGQAKRMAMYYDFLDKNASCMFTTDVMARGVDFQRVDWVVHFDCPDDIESYIHRAGRTARNKSDGHSLLLLRPSEVKMLEFLKAAKIPLKKVVPRDNKVVSISKSFQSFLARSEELKYLAQKAFICYMKSVHLQSNKQVFDVHSIDSQALGTAMGLPGVPILKFSRKNSSDASSSRSVLSSKKLLRKSKPKSHAEKLIAKRNTTVYDQSRAQMRGSEAHADADDVDEFLRVKSKRSRDSDDLSFGPETKRRKQTVREVTDVDDELPSSDDEMSDGEIQSHRSTRMHQLKSRMEQRDVLDQEADADRVRLMHREMKLRKRRREQARHRSSESSGAKLVVADEAFGDDYDDGQNSYSSDEITNNTDDIGGDLEANALAVLRNK